MLIDVAPNSPKLQSRISGAWDWIGMKDPTLVEPMDRTTKVKGMNIISRHGKN
jgi:hypothetical protein